MHGSRAVQEVYNSQCRHERSIAGSFFPSRKGIALRVPLRFDRSERTTLRKPLTTAEQASRPWPRLLLSSLSTRCCPSLTLCASHHGHLLSPDCPCPSCLRCLSYLTIFFYLNSYSDSSAFRISIPSPGLTPVRYPLTQQPTLFLHSLYCNFNSITVSFPIPSLES